MIYHHPWFPRLFYTKPDGGKDSGVTAYFLIEWKKVLSIGLLYFKGSRDALHDHAFNAFTWWLSGTVVEESWVEDAAHFRMLPVEKTFSPSFWPKYTPRKLIHKITPQKEAWALTIRGPWIDYWREYKNGILTTLSHGRRIVHELDLNDAGIK